MTYDPDSSKGQALEPPAGFQWNLQSMEMLNIDSLQYPNSRREATL